MRRVMGMPVEIRMLDAADLHDTDGAVQDADGEDERDADRQGIERPPEFECGLHRPSGRDLALCDRGPFRLLRQCDEFDKRGIIHPLIISCPAYAPVPFSTSAPI